MKQYINGILVEMTTTEATQHVAMQAQQNAEREALVPLRISASRFRIALSRAGIIDEVMTIMADPGTDYETATAWEYDTEIARRGSFIVKFQELTGLSNDEVDDIFRDGGKIA